MPSEAQLQAPEPNELTITEKAATMDAAAREAFLVEQAEAQMSPTQEALNGARELDNHKNSKIFGLAGVSRKVLGHDTHEQDRALSIKQFLAYTEERKDKCKLDELDEEILAEHERRTPNSPEVVTYRELMALVESHLEAARQSKDVEVILKEAKIAESVCIKLERAKKELNLALAYRRF